MDQALLSIIMGAGMFGLMFGMGLALETADFGRVAAQPRTTIIGTALQLLVMPIVGIGLASALSLSPMLATGLVVVSACPGGMFSNMYVYLARGNTALSITLTASATLVTLFTLPLWVRYSLTMFSPAGTATVEMPVLETAIRLGFLTLLPVAIGMFVRQRRPSFTRFERHISIVASILIVAGVVFQGAERPELPVEPFLKSLWAAAWLIVAAISVGIAVPLLFRVSPRDTATIAVELIVKNTLLGIVLVSQAIDFDALIPIFGFASIQAPIGIGVIILWRALDRRGVLGSRAT